MENYDESTVSLTDLEAIAGMVMHAAEAETLEQVLQQIANATRELVGARYAALGVPDGHGGLRYFKVAGISPEQISKIAHPPVGLGLLGVIMNERETVMLEDMSRDHRSAGFPSGHPEMKSLLGVPIQAAGELFGMLYLSDREDGEAFSMHDRWLVETLAGYAALAIAGTELRENQRRITLLEERQRIGMQLHDGVIQSLYAVGMHLDLIRIGTMPPDSIMDAIQGLNSVIDDIRIYIMNLKSQANDNATVRARINDIIARLYIPPSTTISIDALDEPAPIKAEDFDSVCMVVQEALSNIVRHASADYITVRCEKIDGYFNVLIRDNGIGFDSRNHGNREGLGLKNMQARVQHLNGKLIIDSVLGEGTAITLRLPLAH